MAGMRILYAASEVTGFAKTGGLADVAGSLPRALAKRGHECVVFLPLYRAVREGAQPLESIGLRYDVVLGSKTVSGSLRRSVLPGCHVPVYLVEQPDFFERDDPAAGRGLYQFTLPDGSKRDYPDNSVRFIFFCRAILDVLPRLNFWPDVLHLNDWQTGLIPVLLRELYSRLPERAVRERYQQIRTLLTIHNLAYQGVFWHLDMPLTGLSWRLFNSEQLEFYQHLNFLKAGIVFADLLTTVSPTYAREIQTRYFGCGLQGVLAQRAGDLHGIVNGVDYGIWDPAIDRHIAANYDVQSVNEGKPVCKAALQRQYGLAQEPAIPLLGIVSRLVDQKGFDLIGKVAAGLLQQHAQLVVLGQGDPAYHQMFATLRKSHPDDVGVSFALDENLAHQIEAGADIFLMPSQFEPCGLNQLYSLKYGTVPVVRATGGLADTVTDATPETLRKGTATGFSFVPYTPAALRSAVTRALDLYRQDPIRWLALLRTGMAQDWSWDHSAAEYERLYEQLATARTI
jgi:starch synthase